MTTGWMGLVNDFNIAHKKGASGASSGKGANIQVQCPWCNDGSFHLGLSLVSTKFGCWKDKLKHAGRNPSKCISALLKLDIEAAKTIAQRYFDFKQINAAVQFEGQKKREITSIEPKSEFMHFGQKEEMYQQLERQFEKYLKGRNLDPGFITQRFDLRWSVLRDTAYRLIIPITRNGTWYSWTSRSIDQNAFLRYMSCPGADPNNFLLDFDNLRGGKALVLTEGFFDAAAAVSCFVPDVSISCLFGKNISLEQTCLLIYLSELYEKIVLILDKDAWASIVSYQDKLSWYVPNFTCRFLNNQKDFSAMDRSDLSALIKSLI